MFENHSQSEIQLNKNESCNCQASMGNGGKCGETKTLEILKEFQQLYENKLSEITEECSCTSTRLKIQMLEDWVKDLTEQNTMLVQVVEELEQEASERVSLLEEKLRHSSKTSFEIMKTLQAYDAQNISSQSDALQRLMYVQSDVNNLTEFIRRIRDEGKWSTEGLHFYSVSQDALCEVLPKNTRNFGKLKDLEENLMTLKVELAKSKQKKDEYELETKRKELLIREQTEQIEKLNEVVERCSNSVPDRQKLLEELHDVRTQLKAKKEDFSCLELERVQKIIAANMLLEEDINYMKEEMGNLSSELRVLQGLLKLSSSSPSLEEHNLSLTKSLTVLQQHSEALIDQLRMSQKQVTRELKLNDMNLSKITELQKLLESKSEELEETKTQLDVSLLKRKEYENKINSMEESIKEYQKIQEINERKDEMVLNCNSDLICLNEKIEILNQILNEKSNEILRLHAELSIKSDNISCLVKENEITIKDNKKLTQNALNLEGQLAMYKTRCDDLNEKYNKCKAELEKIKNWGDSVHERYKQERKNLLDKLEQVKIEESELNIKLEKSVEQLEKTKLSLMHKDEEVKHLSSAQDEILLLKEEINRLTKQRSRVLSENQRLQEQINSLNISSSQLENRNLIISQQLDKCLQELSTLQLTKDKLEEKNIHLETEVEHLQRAFSELNQEIRYRSESLMSLEQELSETKCSRDEICAESRIVVLNVRSWLDEQKRINIALNETLKEKNLCIEELTMEKNLLMKNIKDLCERYESLTEELHVSRQFMTDCIENKPQSRKSLTPVQRSLYTWGSQNSAGESRTSSPLFIEEHYDYSFDDDREPNPAKWMRKVNDMTEDILNSKKFWKTKMSKSKRIKPVKESKTSIAKTT